MASRGMHRGVFALSFTLAVASCAERPRFELGTECELATQCAAPLVCRLGRCREECRGDRDCRAGLVCLRDRGLGACELEGESCVLSSDCVEPLVCLMGRCTNECATDVDCPPGARCFVEAGGGGCRDVAMMPCQHHTECEPTEICAPDGRCREQCVIDRDCRDGTVCVGMEGERVCVFPTASDAATSDAATSDAAPTDAAPTDGGMTLVGPAPTPMLVAGERHTCASIGADVRCWGDNSFGQLADGTATGTSLVPRVVPALAGATILAAGARHGCSWSGSLRCWGDNASGQVGDGTITRRAAPVAISGVTTSTWIAGGAAHSCAVDGAGAVWCWGLNASGQLGDGTAITRRDPTPTSPLASSAVEVTTRSSHSCARLSDGRVVCWGNNAQGQLGDPSATTLPTPTLVPGVSDAVEVLAGSTFTCARRSDGAVLCWGRNGFGQLGDGTTTSRSTPAVVPGLPPIAELATGADHVCARTDDGRVYCWGDNGFGQAAQDPLVFMRDRLLAPTLVAGLTGVTELAAGDAHTCARVADGFRCWGANMFGQLGDGTTTERWMPAAVSW